MDRGAWQATIHGVAKEMDMTERLNNNNTQGYKANIDRDHTHLMPCLIHLASQNKFFL